jgi:DNA polymerase III gamma/tau subunit
MTQVTTAFHLKYRPRSLDRIIGHEQAVTRLNGLIKSGKVPNAMLFTGPSSAGKTTLARAFACALNGVKRVEDMQGAYQELNAADQRTIDDVRNLIRVSRLKTPFKYRVIVIDEAQQIVSNNAAAQALLKPLEEPSPTTIWILCSMEPAKWTTGVGRAMANRCQQFALDSHSEDDLLKQAKRIMKGEEMDYVEGSLKSIVRNCNGEMRTLANLMQAVANYADGLEKKPKKLDKEALSTVLSTVTPSDDRTATLVLQAVYAGQYKVVVRHLLDVQDGFQFVTKLMWGAQHLLSVAALGGAKHPAIKSWAQMNRDLEKGTAPLKLSLGQLALVNESIVNIKGELLTHGANATELLMARLYRVIKLLYPDTKKSKE